MPYGFQPLYQAYPLDEHQAGPSFSFPDKGKAKEIINATAPPPWYVPGESDESDHTKFDGAWWGWAGKDESYTAGLPAVPIMATESMISRMAAESTPKRIRRRSLSPRPLSTPKHKRKQLLQTDDDDMFRSDATLVDEPFTSSIKPLPPPPLSPKSPAATAKVRRKSSLKLDRNPISKPKPKPKPIDLETVIHRSVDKLYEARNIVYKIQEWQKAETDGSVLPPRMNETLMLERERVEREERNRVRRMEMGHARKRRKLGGEVGEEEAALGMKRATASMLAHAGFDGELDQSTRLPLDVRGTLG